MRILILIGSVVMCVAISRLLCNGANIEMKPSVTLNQHLSSSNHIKVIVFERLIRSTANSAFKQIYFAELSQGEKRLLQSLVKDSDIKDPSEAQIGSNGVFQDKKSGKPGIVLEIKSMEMQGNQAKVLAGYFASAGVTFYFDLVREKEWKIKNVSSPTVVE